jgi:hypothetical protein
VVSEVSTLFLLESRFGSLLGSDADVFWLRRSFTHWFDLLSTLSCSRPPVLWQ